mgnify:CR=1 FL=1
MQLCVEIKNYRTTELDTVCSLIIDLSSASFSTELVYLNRNISNWPKGKFYGQCLQFRFLIDEATTLQTEVGVIPLDRAEAAAAHDERVDLLLLDGVAELLPGVAPVQLRHYGKLIRTATKQRSFSSPIQPKNRDATSTTRERTYLQLARRRVEHVEHLGVAVHAVLLHRRRIPELGERDQRWRNGIHYISLSRDRSSKSKKQKGGGDLVRGSYGIRTCPTGRAWPPPRRDAGRGGRRGGRPGGAGWRWPSPAPSCCSPSSPSPPRSFARHRPCRHRPSPSSRDPKDQKFQILSSPLSLSLSSLLACSLARVTRAANVASWRHWSRRSAWYKK